MPPLSVHVTFPLEGSGRALIEQQNYDLNVYDGPRPQPRDRLLKAIAPCDGLLCTIFDKIDEEILAAAPRLRVVAQFGVGYDNLNVEAATRRGVLVTNTPNVLTDATAELAWALLLTAARRLGEGERLLRAGKWTGWDPGQLRGTAVAGKTLGIVGAGRIGAAMALMSAGFRMNVLYSASRTNLELEEKLKARHVPLDELLAQSDFISIHVPLKPETRHLIGKGEIAKMKPTAVLINTSRGAVIDEAALAEALKARRIAAAGLDVYENEPRVTPGLLELENVVLAPHLGSATRETRDAMGRLAAENLVRVLKGEAPITPVNPSVLAN